MTAEFDIGRGSILLKPETEIEAAFLRWHSGMKFISATLIGLQPPESIECRLVPDRRRPEQSET